MGNEHCSVRRHVYWRERLALRITRLFSLKDNALSHTLEPCGCLVDLRMQRYEFARMCGSERWIAKPYLPFPQMFDEMAERDFIALPDRHSGRRARSSRASWNGASVRRCYNR